LREIKQVLTLIQAAGDLRAGKSFYNAAEWGVGDYFRNSLIADINSLVLKAGIHPVKHGFHRMLASRFPYAIYYTIKGDTAQVAAVLDMRRDPEWIEKQLKKRKS